MHIRKSYNSEGALRIKSERNLRPYQSGVNYVYWSGICLRDAEGEGGRLIDSMRNELEVSLHGDRGDDDQDECA